MNDQTMSRMGHAKSVVIGVVRAFGRGDATMMEVEDVLSMYHSETLVAYDEACANTAGLDDLISEMITRVAELPDRSSPEDWPEAMLITGRELERLLHDFAQAVGYRPTPAGSPQ